MDMNEYVVIKHIEELVSLGGFVHNGITVEYDRSVDIKRFNIKTPDAKFLIGTSGDVLFSLNYIVKRYIEKQILKKEGVFSKKYSFIVDINDYEKERINKLKAMANILADRVRSYKQNVKCEPLLAYERLIIHSYLSNIADVETESVGLGSERRLVIKYKEPVN